MLPTKEYLSHLTLVKGCGSGFEGDRCAIQELRSWIGLDPSVDYIPDCVSPVIGKFVINIQDDRPFWRAQIPAILPRLINSNGSLDLECRRMFHCADWVRKILISTFPDYQKFKDLYPITDQLSAKAADEIGYNTLSSAYLFCSQKQSSRFKCLIREMLDAASSCFRYAIDKNISGSYRSADVVSYAFALKNDCEDPILFIKELLDMKEEV